MPPTKTPKAPAKLGRKPIAADSQPVSLVVSGADLALADTLVPLLSERAFSPQNRPAVLRAALTLGLRELQAQLKKTA